MIDEIAERSRLLDVRSTGLLDTGPEQAYDDLVQLATCICQVPLGLVTLVDEHRLWLKAKVGVPISEVPRDFSFCSYTIQQDDLFVIPDTHKDKRYSSNAAVTSEPYIRFYAGYPLSTSRGEKVGSLCVLDCEPRELSEHQQIAMRVLGRQVMAQIELKQQLQVLHEAIQRKHAAELELQASQRQLENANLVLLQQSLTDPLTSLHNRRSFECALESAFHRSHHGSGPVSLLILDIDFFKKFNDTYGHLQGDEVLRRVSSLILKSAREKDTAARFGGEEFVVILPDTNEKQALQLATCICTAIARRTWNLRPITVSIGVATIDTQMLKAYELVGAADQALYQAKEGGRNRVQAFHRKDLSSASEIGKTTATSAEAVALASNLIVETY